MKTLSEFISEIFKDEYSHRTELSEWALFI